MAGVNRIARRRHPAGLPDRPGSTKSAPGQLDGAPSAEPPQRSRVTLEASVICGLLGEPQPDRNRMARGSGFIVPILVDRDGFAAAVSALGARQAFARRRLL